MFCFKFIIIKNIFNLKSDTILIHSGIGSSIFDWRNAEINYNRIVNKVLFIMRQVFEYYIDTRNDKMPTLKYHFGFELNCYNHTSNLGDLYISNILINFFS